MQVVPIRVTSPARSSSNQPARPVRPARERVAGVGLGPGGTQVGDSAHRQAGQVGYMVSAGSRDGDGQAPIVAGRSATTSSGPWAACLSNTARSSGSLLGNLVVAPIPGGVQVNGVVFALTEVQAEENAVTAGYARVSFV
jgi:hypothetical protein